MGHSEFRVNTHVAFAWMHVSYGLNLGWVAPIGDYIWFWGGGNLLYLLMLPAVAVEQEIFFYASALACYLELHMKSNMEA